MTHRHRIEIAATTALLLALALLMDFESVVRQSVRQGEARRLPGRRSRRTTVADMQVQVTVKAAPDYLPRSAQARQAIARVIANGPAVVLADEPTGILHTRGSLEIMRPPLGLNRDHGIHVLAVNHEDGMACYAHRIAHFVDGRITSDATKQLLLLLGQRQALERRPPEGAGGHRAAKRAALELSCAMRAPDAFDPVINVPLP